MRQYSQKELAKLWRVHPQSVRRWVMMLRKEGRGPTLAQAKIKLIYGARRDLMIRADYAILIQKTFIEGV